jgi:hypothetical protein
MVGAIPALWPHFSLVLPSLKRFVLERHISGIRMTEFSSHPGEICGLSGLCGVPPPLNPGFTAGWDFF